MDRLVETNQINQAITFNCIQHLDNNENRSSAIHIKNILLSNDAPYPLTIKNNQLQRKERTGRERFYYALNKVGIRLCTTRAKAYLQAEQSHKEAILLLINNQFSPATRTFAEIIVGNRKILSQKLITNLLTQCQDFHLYSEKSPAQVIQQLEFDNLAAYADLFIKHNAPLISTFNLHNNASFKCATSFSTQLKNNLKNNTAVSQLLISNLVQHTNFLLNDIAAAIAKAPEKITNQSDLIAHHILEKANSLIIEQAKLKQKHNPQSDIESEIAKQNAAFERYRNEYNKAAAETTQVLELLTSAIGDYLKLPYANLLKIQSTFSAFIDLELKDNQYHIKPNQQFYAFTPKQQLEIINQALQQPEAEEIAHFLTEKFKVQPTPINTITIENNTITQDTANLRTQQDLLTNNMQHINRQLQLDLGQLEAFRLKSIKTLTDLIQTESKRLNDYQVKRKFSFSKRLKIEWNEMLHADKDVSLVILINKRIIELGEVDSSEKIIKILEALVREKDIRKDSNKRMAILRLKDEISTAMKNNA